MGNHCMPANSICPDTSAGVMSAGRSALPEALRAEAEAKARKRGKKIE
jgi:hypothetical protein